MFISLLYLEIFSSVAGFIGVKQDQNHSNYFLSYKRHILIDHYQLPSPLQGFCPGKDGMKRRFLGESHRIFVFAIPGYTSISFEEVVVVGTIFSFFTSTKVGLHTFFGDKSSYNILDLISGC